MNVRLDDLRHFHQHLVQMLHGKTHAENVLDEKHWDMFIMQVPDDKADDEERKIDNNVVDDFVQKLEPDPTSYTVSHNV